MKITNRYTGVVIFEDSSSSIKETLINAIKSGVDLSGADLSYADLRGADLSGANLSGVDLSGVDLSGVDLSYADLRGANLSGADLSYADLRGADLSGADLSDADLSGADLSDANLRGANLSDAKGTNTISELVLSRMRIVPSHGSFIGWKKLENGTICKLQIPEDAKRCGGVVGRKCRASKAIVLDGNGVSSHDNSFKYEVGKVVKPKEPYCENEFSECESGIHFYITKEEAQAHC